MGMKKWYRSNLAKVLLIMVAILTPVVAAVSFTMLANTSSVRGYVLPLQRAGDVYEESGSFQERMRVASEAVLTQIRLEEELETDGVYDPDKLVDIVDFYETGVINADNTSGLSYTIGQLADWGDELGYGIEYVNDIVVCQQPDKTYHYYYMSEFEKLLSDNKLRVELGESDQQTFLSNLEEGVYYSDYDGGNMVIRDEAGEIQYTGCWTFDPVPEGKFAPEGASSLLEVVNKNPELNGKLSDVYRYLENAATRFSDDRAQYNGITDQWEEGNSNFAYLYLDADAKKVYTNNSSWEKYEDAQELIGSMEKDTMADDSLRYILLGATLKEFATNIEAEVDSAEWQSLLSDYVELDAGDVFVAAVDTAYPIQDSFYTSMKEYQHYAPYLEICKVGLVLSILLFVTAVIWLTLITGRRADSEELYVTSFEKVKTEIAAALVIGAWGLLTMCVASIWTDISGYYDAYQYFQIWGYYSNNQMIVLGVYAGLTAVLFQIGYLSLVRRIKDRSLWKNSLLRIFCSWLGKGCKVLLEFWRSRKLIWRGLLIYLVVLLMNWLVPGSDSTFPYFLMWGTDLVLGYYLCTYMIQKQKILTGLDRIADGEVDYKISTEKMRGDAKQEAEYINSIGEGLNVALEKSMKSERLKTDLITNVSHDIKTPLTSIINYVDLLKQEDFEDPKIKRYLEILDEKSQRLKTLTEDVVEASKVSSGNITMEYTNLNLGEIIRQTSGEFAEKFEARGLKEILTLPEEPVVIRADGRRMWRILSNIYNNAAKYAMEGTRIYADLRVVGSEVQFNLKNISEQPLNISAEELTERFIRGDVSRSTEGSGLGLSIAENLTKMQGGEFKLYLDGDLFRVTLTFPRIA